MKKAICQILVDEGYIKGMQVKNDTVQGTIVVTLKYQVNGEPVIAGLRRVSKPGLRIYTNCEDMPKVMKGLGTAIISTSKGIMTVKAGGWCARRKTCMTSRLWDSFSDAGCIRN